MEGRRGREGGRWKGGEGGREGDGRKEREGGREGDGKKGKRKAGRSYRRRGDYMKDSCSECIYVFVYHQTVAKFQSTYHSAPQASDSRDSTSMRLYACLFRWILGQINARIRGAEEKFAFVGILDIFGFENFTVNRFEQFNINFANEKLQEYFNKHIFSLEQHEYSKYD